MSWSIQPLETSGPLFEGAISVYREAFSRPPYSDNERATEVRKRVSDIHQKRPSFRAFAAVHSDGRPIGITYGYHSQRGQWWYDTVESVLKPEQRQRWLSDAYEVVEVAVAPAFQSFGVGRALVHRLLQEATESTCVLSTRTDSRAHELYSRLGFEVIVEMPFAAGGHHFYIMGKPLG